MCGLTFFISKTDLKKELLESLKCIQHRGPDFTDTKIINHNDFIIGFGHNRLSINDLSESGNQPYEFNGLILVFNGEIYNHKELRLILENNNYTFVGTSDTEVLIKLFDLYGVECFRLLNGMYSFVLHDSKINKSFIVRDSFGIKPLYFYTNKDVFIVSSEIKGLLPFGVNKELSTDDLFCFFNNGFLYEPNTGYKFIKKVFPSTYLEYDVLENKFETIKYSIEPKKFSVREAIKRSVELQSESDVNTGMFFSGGVDSSVLAIFNKNLKLLFAKYSNDNHNSDYHYSKLIAEKLSSKVTNISLDSSKKSPDQLIEKVNFVAKYSEELISDFTFFSSYELSKSAKDLSYKVMLSGMGGDELFMGYPRYKLIKYSYYYKLFFWPILILSKLKFSIFDNRVDRFKSFFYEKDFLTKYTRLLGYFDTAELKILFKDYDCLHDKYISNLNSIVHLNDSKFSTPLDVAKTLDRYGFLSHNLIVADKSSMLASIELRVPFLSEDIDYVSSKKNLNEYLSLFNQKIPLLQILKEFLPLSFFKRKKSGFNPPIDNLINSIGYERLKQEFADIDFVSTDFCDNLLKMHFIENKNSSYKIWQLLYYKYWVINNA